MKDYIDQSISNNQRICTFAGLSFEPDWNTCKKFGKRNIVNYFLPLATYAHVYFNIERSVAIGACGSGLIKQYEDRLGVETMVIDNKKLDPIKIPSAGNEDFVVMGLNKLKDEAIKSLFEYKELWKNRIHIKGKKSRGSVDSNVDDMLAKFIAA